MIINNHIRQKNHLVQTVITSENHRSGFEFIMELHFQKKINKLEKNKKKFTFSFVKCPPENLLYVIEKALGFNMFNG